MDVRHSEMIARLFEHGWRVVSRARDDLVWWADEIWTVESEWSPQGFTVYLSWLVDPQWEGPRPPGQGVWAVGTCLQHPGSDREAKGHLSMSINHWPRDLPAFLSGLSALRDQGKANPPSPA